LSRSVKVCHAVFAGCVDYPQALDWQLRICRFKREGYQPDVLLLLEHPPTITLGRRGQWANLLASEAVLHDRGIQRYEVDRGGDITFHGPGQLVGYPILLLGPGERDVHRYMRNLEEVLIRTLNHFGVESSRVEGRTGVWTARGKVAAMGVHVSRWITRHGFALNVDTDLSYFDLIHPCGLIGQDVTSMAAILGRPLDMRQIAERTARDFAEVFERRLLAMSPSRLECELNEFSIAGRLCAEKG